MGATPTPLRYLEHVKSLPDIPEVVRQVARRCRDAGGRALLVGGSVRDHLLGQPVKDWDIEVSGLEEDRLFAVLRRVGRVDAVGRAFGVFKLHRDDVEVDVSLPRRDSKVGAGHKGIAVQGDPTMPPREAARRRDLTINAIMLDVLSGEVLDPWGGRRDLEAGLLRAVDDATFLEDPLRALRAVQFAARLDFRVDPGLEALCGRAALHELPAERIQGEWHKLMLKSRTPSTGLALARRAGILARVFPEAAACDHADVDVALDRLATGGRDALDPEGRRWAVMLAAWLHRCDTEAVTATLDRLWLHKWLGYPLRDRVLAAARCWREDPVGDAGLRHLSTCTELCVTLWTRWAVLGRPEPLDRLERAHALGIAYEPPARLLLGRHLGPLGVPPGPRMGEILREVYQRQLDGEVTTLDEAKAAARRLVEDA